VVAEELAKSRFASGTYLKANDLCMDKQRRQLVGRGGKLNLS